MKKLWIICCLVSFIGTSQNIEKPFEFQDSLFSASLFKNIKLSANFSLKPGLTLRSKPHSIQLKPHYF
jgi:hypothetical protein